MAATGTPVVLNKKSDGNYTLAEALHIDVSSLKVDVVNQFNSTSGIDFQASAIFLGVSAVGVSSNSIAAGDTFVSAGKDILDVILDVPGGASNHSLLANLDANDHVQYQATAVLSSTVAGSGAEVVGWHRGSAGFGEHFDAEATNVGRVLYALTSTANHKGANLVGFNDTNSIYASTNVGDVLDELTSQVEGKGCALIGFTNVGGFDSTSVQSALSALDLSARTHHGLNNLHYLQTAIDHSTILGLDDNAHPQYQLTGTLKSENSASGASLVGFDGATIGGYTATNVREALLDLHSQVNSQGANLVGIYDTYDRFAPDVTNVGDALDALAGSAITSAVNLGALGARNEHLVSGLDGDGNIEVKSLSADPLGIVTLKHAGDHIGIYAPQATIGADDLTDMVVASPQTSAILVYHDTSLWENTAPGDAPFLESSGGILAGDLRLLGDTHKIRFGAGGDSEIYFNGTDTVWNGGVVVSSKLILSAFTEIDCINTPIHNASALNVGAAGAPLTGFQIACQGSYLASGGAQTGSGVRNGGFYPWVDKRFGIELHYDGTDYATAIFGGAEAGDTDCIRFGSYAANEAGQGDFNLLAVLRKDGNFGVGKAVPLEDVHVADTVRADTFFNHNGTDGVTTSLSWTNGDFTTNTLTTRGGIVTVNMIS